MDKVVEVHKAVAGKIKSNLLDKNMQIMSKVWVPCRFDAAHITQTSLRSSKPKHLDIR